MADKYDVHAVERKWRERWETSRAFATRQDPQRPKFYYLDMFAYPSGDAHMGHVRNYTVGDVVARYHYMRGENVLHPMGWDAFGLPAEEAAMKRNTPARQWTHRCIAKMREQLKGLGISFDWEREITTCDVDYYRWTQWLFLQLFHHGLAEKKRAILKWCPSCATVLANEQVIDGTCERCGAEVTATEREQWFFLTTRYADRLLEGHNHIDWPEDVKAAQRHWIGRSEGVEFSFEVETPSGEVVTLPVFTTRIDTLYGVTFVTVAPEHPLMEKLIDGAPQQTEVEEYVTRAKAKSAVDRAAADNAKTGIFTGSYARHPLTGERTPVWVSEYVLMDYGTGAVMAVPAHDQRDLEFARLHDLEVRVVIQPPDERLDAATMTEAYIDPGVQVNSDKYDGLPSEEAKDRIAADLEAAGIGRRTTNYRLRDWCVSRQRYWGCPIPILYCPECGMLPVPEDQLPVLLPDDVEITGKGESPLASAAEFVNTTCPQCGAAARRETDTMDTFVCSSWYFLRYASPHYDDGPFDPEAVKYWLPVDLYIGGREHATMHLIFARFFTMALHDIGLLDFDEPFARLFNHGVVTLEGEKMSKSKGNIVSPDEVVSDYGADAMRLYILFMAPGGERADWQAGGVSGVAGFLHRAWRLVFHCAPLLPAGWHDRLEGTDFSEASMTIRRRTHQTIARVSADIERFKFNTAISAMMELVNEVTHFVEQHDNLGGDTGVAAAEACHHLTTLLSPFAPHLADELWELLGGQGTVYHQPWPAADADIAREERVTIIVQVNGKLRDRFQAPRGVDKTELEQMALAAPAVQSHVSGKEVRRVIVVPDKLVNIVAA